MNLLEKLQPDLNSINSHEGKFINFTAETKMSGIDLTDGTEIRKGAWDAMKKWTGQSNGAETEY